MTIYLTLYLSIYIAGATDDSWNKPTGNLRIKYHVSHAEAMHTVEVSAWLLFWISTVAQVCCAEDSICPEGMNSWCRITVWLIRTLIFQWHSLVLILFYSIYLDHHHLHQHYFFLFSVCVWRFCFHPRHHDPSQSSSPSFPQLSIMTHHRYHQIITDRTALFFRHHAPIILNKNINRHCVPIGSLCHNSHST